MFQNRLLTEERKAIYKKQNDRLVHMPQRRKPFIPKPPPAVHKRWTDRDNIHPFFLLYTRRRRSPPRRPLLSRGDRPALGRESKPARPPKRISAASTGRPFKIRKQNLAGCPGTDPRHQKKGEDVRHRIVETSHPPQRTARPQALLDLDTKKVYIQLYK